MTVSWRLIDSGPLPPLESAAVDEAILKCHSQGFVQNTLHVYRRSSPTISLGYFQRAGQLLNLDECKRRGITLIRRRSGGGSIFTDQGQLIYGLILSRSELPRTPEESFRQVCTSLACAISRFGVSAKYRPVNDVEVGGRKVSGSAQLRMGGSVLQHGTILVDADLDVMDAVLMPDREKDPGMTKPSERVTTIARESGSLPSMGDIRDAVIDEFGRTFCVEFEESQLSERESEMVGQFIKERYSTDEWNLKY